MNEPVPGLCGHRPPRHHGPVGDGLGAVGDDAVDRELEPDAEPGAVGAGTVRRVEREQPRLELGQAADAVRYVGEGRSRGKVLVVP